MSGAYAGYDAGQVAERLTNWPLFDARTYLRVNPDVASYAMGPADHFARYGCWTHRHYTTERRLIADLAEMGVPRTVQSARALDLDPRFKSKADIGVYCNSGSNVFMREIAHNLASALQNLGLKVTVGNERTHPHSRRPHSIIVAPHEFFILGMGTEWAHQEIVSDCVLLSTEQPQTQWFSLSVPYLFSCRGVLDLCWQTSAAFEIAGVASSFYMPGLPENWSPELPCGSRVMNNALISALSEEVLAYDGTDPSLHSRPIDLVFMASRSPIRDDFMKRHVVSIGQLKNVLLYRQVGSTVPVPYADDDLITSVNDFIHRRSKILLNIHRDNLGYFEVHRFATQGFWNLTTVVTNKCVPHPNFTANEHYFEEATDRIPKLVHWLIKTPEGRREAEEMRWRAINRCIDSGSARLQALRAARFVHRCFSGQAGK
jgi:hypothetical protein